MSRICLCMIVRDESAVIERCLTSVRPLINSWVICDTGSRDGTPELIERALAGVPGSLHRRPWRDFGHNRSELMRLARGAADYLFLLDADMTVRVRTTQLPQLTADSYLLCHSGEPEYWIKRLVRGDCAWRYEGSTHEYLITDEPDDEARLEGVIIDHHADGGARTDKLERDVRLLTGDLRRNVNNARSVFYLAQTYRDMGRPEQSLELYERRAGMGGWDEEVFYSLYQSGVLRAQLDDWPSAMAMLVRAWEYRPARLEPLYELASRLRQREEYETAHLFAVRGVGRPVPADILFVHPWIYSWGMLFEFSITSYWTGNARAALRACQQLLAMPDLPKAYRDQTVINRRFCAERVGDVLHERGRSGTHTGQSGVHR
jgi:tetratricopeptide (TPR) repeat protein